MGLGTGDWVIYSVLITHYSSLSTHTSSPLPLIPPTPQKGINMKIDGKTQLVGIIGWPVSHSFSPKMHNAAFADLGLNWVYLPFPVEPSHVDTAVLGLAAAGIRGINVTVPHKQAVIPLLAEIEDGAKAIGAVNTIVMGENGRLSGYNTDWAGFLADLQEKNVPIAGRDCLVLGAGGSARGIAYALAHAGGNVQILARRVTQAQTLVQDLAPFFTDGVLQERPFSDLPTITQASQAPLIINTTPLGMTPNVGSSVWPDDLPMPPDSFVYDLVYNPTTSKIMHQAGANGCGACNGLGMLVHQGVLAFKLWTGQQPNIELMTNIIRPQS